MRPVGSAPVPCAGSVQNGRPATRRGEALPFAELLSGVVAGVVAKRKGRRDHPLALYLEPGETPRVRRGSIPAEDHRFRPVPRNLPRDVMRAALAREYRTRPAHDRRKNGHVGDGGLRVLNVLAFHRLNPATGRCDPTLETIAADAGISVSTVVRALADLERLELLSTRVRRWVLRERKPEQTSNAYALRLPAWHRPAPEPGDVAGPDHGNQTTDEKESKNKSNKVSGPTSPEVEAALESMARKAGFELKPPD